MTKIACKILLAVGSFVSGYCANAQTYETFFNDTDVSTPVQRDTIEQSAANIPFIGPSQPDMEYVPTVIHPDPVSVATAVNQGTEGKRNTENIPLAPDNRLLYIILIGGGVLSLSTTIFFMRAMWKTTSVDPPVVQEVARINAQTSVEDGINFPDRAEKKSPARSVATRNLVERAFNAIESDRVVTKERFELSTLARKLGVSRGEIDLKIHLQELKESAA